MSRRYNPSFFTPSCLSIVPAVIDSIVLQLDSLVISSFSTRDDHAHLNKITIIKPFNVINSLIINPPWLRCPWCVTSECVMLVGRNIFKRSIASINKVRMAHSSATGDLHTIAFLFHGLRVNRRRRVFRFSSGSVAVDRYG